MHKHGKHHAAHQGTHARQNPHTHPAPVKANGNGNGNGPGSGTQAMHQPVLVLNASYEPINICAARRAIVLVLKGVAMTEEENGHYLHAARIAMRVPSVIRRSPCRSGCASTAASI